MKYIENKTEKNIADYLKTLKDDKSFPQHLIPLIDFFIRDLSSENGDTSVIKNLYLKSQIEIINTYLPTKYKIK